MKVFGNSTLIFGVVLIAVCVADRLTSKYDNVNVDSILANDRVLTNYIKCLMDEGPCTAEGRELKKTLPGALSTGCKKCNEKQKETAEKVITHLVKKKNREWVRLSKKYDPKGEYKARYEALLTTSTTIKPKQPKANV